MSDVKKKKSAEKRLHRVRSAGFRRRGAVARSTRRKDAIAAWSLDILYGGDDFGVQDFMLRDPKRLSQS
jgi:hypothetical protein